MADYKEQSIPGTLTSFQRCHQITIQNPYNDLASANVRFDEEIIKTLPDGEILKSAPPNGGITKEFDPNAVIALRNPVTWELTGQTITVGDIYTALLSAYYQFAVARDADIPPDPELTPEQIAAAALAATRLGWAQQAAARTRSAALATATDSTADADARFRALTILTGA